MTKLNFTIHQNNNKRRKKLFGVVSLSFAIVGLFFLPLSILGIIFGHLASNNKSQNSNQPLNIYARAGLIISYSWLIFTVVSVVVYMLLK